MKKGVSAQRAADVTPEVKVYYYLLFYQHFEGDNGFPLFALFPTATFIKPYWSGINKGTLRVGTFPCPFQFVPCPNTCPYFPPLKMIWNVFAINVLATQFPWTSAFRNGIKTWAGGVTCDPWRSSNHSTSLNSQILADIYSNVSTSLLKESFVNEHAQQLWTSCCEAAEQCCQKIQIPWIPENNTVVEGEINILIGRDQKRNEEIIERFNQIPVRDVHLLGMVGNVGQKGACLVKWCTSHVPSTCSFTLMVKGSWRTRVDVSTRIVFLVDGENARSVEMTTRLWWQLKKLC